MHGYMALLNRGFFWHFYITSQSDSDGEESIKWRTNWNGTRIIVGYVITTEGIPAILGLT